MNAAPSQVVLAMQGVSVTRGAKRILGPIDFRIQSGERWVILGPNGAGKSTPVSYTHLTLPTNREV